MLNNTIDLLTFKNYVVESEFEIIYLFLFFDIIT